MFTGFFFFEGVTPPETGSFSPGNLKTPHTHYPADDTSIENPYPPEYTDKKKSGKTNFSVNCENRFGSFFIFLQNWEEKRDGNKEEKLIQFESLKK